MVYYGLYKIKLSSDTQYKIIIHLLFLLNYLVFLAFILTSEVTGFAFVLKMLASVSSDGKTQMLLQRLFK